MAELKPTARRLKVVASGLAVGYYSLVVTPVILKTFGLTRIAAWPWSKALFTIWAPWVLLLLLLIYGWVKRRIQRYRGRG